MNRSNLVTTRTNIVIGGHFVPKPPEQSRDADAIQAALLEPPAPLAERALDSLNRLFPYLMGAMVVGGLLLGAALRVLR